MKLSWAELSYLITEKLHTNDFQDLLPLLENVQALNQSFAVKILEPGLFSHIDSLIKEMFQLLQTEPVSIQQMTDKIQALSDSLQYVVENKIPPLFLSQFWYTDRMKALGYKISGEGECYGMSYMAIQAFLANDLGTFNKRLQIIYDMPFDDFKNDFAELKDKKNLYLIEERVDEADEIDRTIIDVQAFFDGVSLNQTPYIYLPDEANQPISKKQDVRKSMTITMSVQLETKHLNQPAIIGNLTGFYTRENLIDYFNLLKKTFGQYSFALHLVSVSHAIAVTYDAKSKVWLLIDPNKLPGENYIGSNYLVDELLTGFAQGKYLLDSVVMATQIFTIAQHEQSMRLEFEQLQKTNLWSTLHPSSSMSNADLLGLTPITLYQKCYENESIIWNDSDLLSVALAYGQQDVVTHILNTKGIKPFLDLGQDDYQKLSDLLLDLPFTVQHILLEQLSLKQKINLLNTNPSLMQILPEHERSSVFLKLRPWNQRQCLVEITDAQLTEQSTMLLQQLTIEQRVRILMDQDIAHYSDCCIDLLKGLPEDQSLQMMRQVHIANNRLFLNTALNNLPEKQRLDAVKTKNKAGNTVLHMVQYNPECLAIILQLYPEDERLEALAETSPAQGHGVRGSVLYKCVNNSHLLAAALNSLPENPRPEEIKEKSQSVSNLLNNSRIYSNSACLWGILTNLPEEQRITAVTEQDKDGYSLLHNVLIHPECLIAILNTIPENRLLGIFQELNDLWFLALDHPNSLDILLNFYPARRRFEVLQTNTDSGNSILDYAAAYPDSMIVILNVLSDEEQYEVLLNDADSFQQLNLFSEMKAIMLNKIRHADNHSIFNSVKQYITHAGTCHELIEHLEELNSLLRAQPVARDRPFMNNQAMIKKGIEELISEEENLNPVSNKKL